VLTGSQASTAESVFSGRFRVTSVGLLVIVTLIAFEAMSVTTALPTAARQLHGLSSYGWAFSGFLIANTVGLVTGGLVCDRRGPRVPIVGGVGLFLTGLVVAGTATEMWQLILGRVVQGLGSGLLMTSIYVVVGQTYPTALRPKFMVAISAAWVTPSLIGPPVAGAVTEHLSWRLVFLGLVPLVVVGAALLIPVLLSLSGRPAQAAGLAEPERLLQVLALAIGLALLVEAGQHPHLIWLLLTPVGAVGLIWGLRTLLPAGTFQVRTGVPATVALRGLFAGAFFGADSLVPLTLSIQHGYSPIWSGLPLLVASVTWAGGSWIQGRSWAAGQRPRLVRAGFVCLLLGCVGAAVAALPGATGPVMYLAWFFGGLGAGLTITTVGVLMMDWTNDRDRGRDSASIQLSDVVASALTTGIGGVLIAAAAHNYIGYSAAFVAVDLTMAALAGVGFVAAGRLRRRPHVPSPAGHP
jgi:MFS family permease